MELLRVAIEAEDAVLVDVVLLLLEQFLRVLYEVHDSVLFLAI